jgi:hypothetical protein
MPGNSEINAMKTLRTMRNPANAPASAAPRRAAPAADVCRRHSAGCALWWRLEGCTCRPRLVARSETPAHPQDPQAVPNVSRASCANVARPVTILQHENYCAALRTGDAERCDCIPVRTVYPRETLGKPLLYPAVSLGKATSDGLAIDSFLTLRGTI